MKDPKSAVAGNAQSTSNELRVETFQFDVPDYFRSLERFELDESDVIEQLNDELARNSDVLLNVDSSYAVYITDVKIRVKGIRPWVEYLTFNIKLYDNRSGKRSIVYGQEYVIGETNYEPYRDAILGIIYDDVTEDTIDEVYDEYESDINSIVDSIDFSRFGEHVGNIINDYLG